jgi:metal-responsive CopG/Arc/MetJ family transcriptional regulator
MRSPDFRDGVAVLIPLRELGKSIRVNVTINEETLREIDAYAEEHGLTRSGFLQVAAKKVLEEEAA